MTRRLRFGALIAIATFALAACGSGSGASAAPASQAPVASAPAASAPAASAPAASAPASAAAGACSTGSGTGTAAEIKNFSFPTGLTVKAGDSITWTNGDSANHTVTFDDGSCDTAVDSGSSVTVTYTVPGTYAFHCKIHTSMTGSLTVN